MSIHTMNTMRTILLQAATAGLLLFVGQALGGEAGMLIALVIAVVMNFGRYWYSGKLVLKMYHAQEQVRRLEAQAYGR